MQKFLAVALTSQLTASTRKRTAGKLRLQLQIICKITIFMRPPVLEMTLVFNTQELNKSCFIINTKHIIAKLQSEIISFPKRI